MTPPDRPRAADEIRTGEFGIVDARLGAPLSAKEVALLPEGARIVVIWSGGNGPHEYVIHRQGEYAYAAQPGHPRFDLYNPLEFVGTEKFHTRVWVRPEAESQP